MTGRVHELVPRGAAHADGRGTGARRARRGDARRPHTAARGDRDPRHPRQPRARAAHLARAARPRGSRRRGRSSRASAPAPSASPFLGVGLLAGQLMRTSRGANSLAVWVLLLTFLFGGIGNALGTPDRRPAAHRELVADLALAVRLGRELPAVRRRQRVAAAAVRRVRTGAGRASSSPCSPRATSARASYPSGAGGADAPASLAGPTALVWRLTRGSILGWSIGGLLTGLLATSLAGVLGDVVEELPSVRGDPRRDQRERQHRAGRRGRSSSRCSASSRRAPRCRPCAARGRKRRTARPSRCWRPRSIACAGSPATSSSASARIVLVAAAAVIGAALGLAGRGQRLGAHGRRGRGRRRAGGGGIRLPRPHRAGLRARAPPDHPARLDARLPRDGARAVRPAVRLPGLARAHRAHRDRARP